MQTFDYRSVNGAKRGARMARPCFRCPGSTGRYLGFHGESQVVGDDHQESFHSAVNFMMANQNEIWVLLLMIHCKWSKVSRVPESGQFKPPQWNQQAMGRFLPPCDASSLVGNAWAPRRNPATQYLPGSPRWMTKRTSGLANHAPREAPTVPWVAP